MDFIVQNKEALLGVVAAVIALGLAIAPLTKTKKDDSIFKTLSELFSKLVKK